MSLFRIFCLLVPLFCGADEACGADDCIGLLQTRASKKSADPVANDEGNWWPTDCDKLPEFELGTPTQSNLGGGGPDDGASELVYANAGLVDDEKVDVVITAGEHTSAEPELNGVKPGTVIGRLSIKSGTTSSVTFSLRSSANKQAKSVDFLALTFLDIDEGKDGNSRTTVTVPDATDLYVSGNTELTQSDDCTGVASSTKGTGKDNPKSIATLDELQKSRTATFIVKAGSSWKVNFEVADPDFKSGRFVMFKVDAVIPCHVDGGARCGGPKPVGPPATCGNNCNAGFAPKRCAFWGDPHYQRTFNSAGGNNFDLHFFGVVTLAKTTCNSVEIQAVQCPWHGGGAAISSGFAVREGSKVATIIGNTVRNADGLNIREGHPRWFHSADMCTRAWFKTNGHIGTPGRSYYMDMEIQMQEASLGEGNCNGQRRNFPTAADDLLFTSDELRRLCGHCRFACPGALLEQDPVGAAEVTPESMCQQMGIDYATADEKCQQVHASNPDADKFVHDSCIMDYCGSEGDDEIIGFEEETEEIFQKEDAGESGDPDDVA